MAKPTTQEPTFYFNVKVAGWEAGSVFADFCRKNNIKAEPSLNGHDPVQLKQPRHPTVGNRKRPVKLTKLQVVAVEDFLKKNPNLTDGDVVRQMKLPCGEGTVWRIRHSLHVLQNQKKK